MRYTAALTPPGTVRPRARGVRGIVIAVAVVAAVLWMLYSYAQEAYLAHRLAQHANDLRTQNALIAEQNTGYHRDIQAIGNGSADEEEARLNGYSRPFERVYLVTAPPSPTPVPSPSAKASPSQ